jgi:two-component system, chemotaxis family, CheB/CheR fusion protein
MEETTKPQPTEPERPAHNGDFPVVGLGASAGGLKALIQFFELMPANSGMAFVVIMHLSPKHESHSPALLQNVTKMPVTQVNESVRVEPNHVYVIPPTKHLAMMDGMISLSEPGVRGVQHAAIDLFFRTLADARRDRAICIVLSGTGADGATGLKRVKEQGGVALAQSPEDAEHDAMPRNAISTGAVDFVLPVAEMPDKLVQLWQNASKIRLPAADEPIRIVDPSLAAEEALPEVLAILRARTGHDFTHYKRATMLRRIERRLQVNQLPDLPAYCDFLRAHQEEAHALLQDMLISVTNFFRDREAFEALEREVIPHLFADKTSDDLVRVWVAGCASGEEAYSVAILLSEHAAGLPQPPAIQVFATDIDEDRIVSARAGNYPDSIITDIAPTRLRNFFTKEPGGYTVKKSLRERILFTVHNLLKDPPFSRLDLIVCRNLMIYLNRDVQGQVLELFHFALHPGGYIFLGSAESADGATDLFTTVDKKHRLFRANVVSRTTLRVPRLPLGIPLTKAVWRAETASERRRLSFSELHQRLLEQYAPPSVIINRDYDIVHLSDRAGRFLQFAGGEPSHNLLKVIHPELRLDLRTALFQAIQTGKSTEARRVRLHRDGHNYYVNMIARPVLGGDDAQSGFILVIFDEIEEILGPDGLAPGAVETDPVLHSLESELVRTKEQLQGTIEQYEASNEELRASNEELQAVNEELRSVTEELETSKEELQSINEELTTVNLELKNKVDEVSSVNDDLKNLISSTDIALIFIDRHLRIKRYTPRALELFNLIPGDFGRPLSDITHRLDYARLIEETEQVLDTLRPIEREVAGEGGGWYIARLSPYRTLDDHIDGVVLTFIDITARKHWEEQLRQSEERLHLMMANVLDYAIFIVDVDGRIERWNVGAERMFGYTAAEAVGQHCAIIFTPEDRARGLPEAELRQARERGQAADERWHMHKDGSRFYVSGVMSALRDDHLTGYVKIARDLTERRKSEEELEEAVQARTHELSEANLSLVHEVGERTNAEARVKELLRQIISAQEDERQRISRELHDHLGQLLTALQLNLASLTKRNVKSGDLRAGVTQAQEVAKQIDAGLDFLIWELRPAALDDLGLPAAIANFTAEWSKHFDVPAEFHSRGLDHQRFTPEVEINLYRIAQEALNNVAKHAQANRVDVLIERRQQDLVLIIEDDGIGFEYQQQQQPNERGRGLGLLGMRKRVALVGGTMEIESAPGSGTTVFVRVPLSTQAEGQ